MNDPNVTSDKRQRYIDRWPHLIMLMAELELCTYDELASLVYEVMVVSGRWQHYGPQVRPAGWDHYRNWPYRALLERLLYNENRFGSNPSDIRMAADRLGIVLDVARGRNQPGQQEQHNPSPMYGYQTCSPAGQTNPPTQRRRRKNYVFPIESADQRYNGF